MKTKCQFITCQSEEDFKIAKQLTLDYLEWLGIDLDYQGTENELNSLNKIYNHPKGAFIYILIDNKLAGGAGVRFLKKDICEMKRLFIYNEFRGQQLGLLLCNKLIETSKKLGYKRMRLDTVSKLETAIKLYQQIGFYQIEPYCENPDATAKFMELVL